MHEQELIRERSDTYKGTSPSGRGRGADVHLQAKQLVGSPAVPSFVALSANTGSRDRSLCPGAATRLRVRHRYVTYSGQ